MKKIFTIRRVILLMSLILIYSCAFLFVKIYAERSILSGNEPSNASLYNPNKKVDSAPDDTDQPNKHEVPKPVEHIVDKMNADRYPMFSVEATHVPDTIEVSPSSDVPAVTAPPATSDAPTTKASTTTTPEKTTPPATEPPVTASTEPPAENIDDESEFEEIEDEIPDEPDGDYDDGFGYLTPEELQDLLDRLGQGGFSNNDDNYFPDDKLISGNSYKNQTLTIYDTTLGRMRTENAFELVCQVTAHEISSSYNREAIKAQAIAAYSYIKHYEQRGEYAKIGTKSNVPSIIIECVEEIDGLAMFYNDEYVMAAFSASTGGYSASAEKVWGGGRPYLQSVKNDFDQLDERYYGLTTTYTVEEVCKKIEANTDIKLSNNYSEWIKVLNWHDTIYADELSIDGHTTAYINGRTRTITGYYFRTYILNIRSTAFSVSYNDGIFTFTTYGYGHGVGMSQVGANLYANIGGYTFDQILHHYYTGITIK